MTLDAARTVLDALQLPDSALLDQRIPKKLLLEHVAPTAANKRLINEAIEQIQWLAVLKPNTVGVAEYRDEQREYLEIAVLGVALRGATTPARHTRLAELIHRAIPYPLLLLLEHEHSFVVSLAHKRWAQNEAGRVVLDGDVVMADVRSASSEPSGATSATFERSTPAAATSPAATGSEVAHAFLQSLPMGKQPHGTLLALYQGWMHGAQALQAAALTGRYRAATSPKEAAARRDALAECERLQAEINRLRAQAAKEKQLARRVDLNLALKRIQAELAAAQQNL